MKKKDKTALTAIVVFVFTALVLFVLFVPAPRHKGPSSMPRPAPAEAREPARTLEEMQEFFDTRRSPLLLETFPNRRFHLPEIQARYDALAQMIRHRYGKEYTLAPTAEYMPTSTRVTAESRIDDGVPTCVIFMPSLMDLWEAEKKAGVSDDESEREFVVDFLHELDHLAHGFVSVTGEALSVEQWLDNERRTWAETYEHTIRPLIEKHRLSIAPRHFFLYQAWVSGWRNVDSERWVSFIKEQYTALLR